MVRGHRPEGLGGSGLYLAHSSLKPGERLAVALRCIGDGPKAQWCSWWIRGVPMDAMKPQGRRAQQQQERRLATRVCGRCGAGAELMLDWGRQSIPICHPCNELLELAAYGYAWRKLEGQGIWCDVEDHRPCTDCILFQVEGRILEPVTGLVIQGDLLAEPRPGVWGRLLGALGRMLPTRTWRGG